MEMNEEIKVDCYGDAWTVRVGEKLIWEGYSQKSCDAVVKALKEVPVYFTVKEMKERARRYQQNAQYADGYGYYAAERDKADDMMNEALLIEREIEAAYAVFLANGHKTGYGASEQEYFRRMFESGFLYARNTKEMK